MNRTGLLVALVALAAYSGVLWVPFVFDDWHVISQNPAVHAVDYWRYFTDPTAMSILPGNQGYRPLFLTRMAAAWSVGGGSPFPFHLESLLLHIINAVLVWWLVRRTVSDGAAVVAGTLFAMHPAASEAVVYISAQSVLIATAGVLMALALHIEGRMGWAQAAFAFGLLGKPTAIVLPLLVLLYEWLLGKRRILALWPYAVTALAYLGLRAWVMGDLTGGPPPRDYSEHFIIQTHALVWYYLRLAVIPTQLNVDRAYSAPGDEAVAALVILWGLGMALVMLQRNRALLFWALWFPACLLLTTYVKVLGQLVNEHRVYLSLAGACAVAGIAVDRLMDKRQRRAITTLGVCLVMMHFGAATFFRVQEWQSALTLWEAAAQRGGTWRAHMNYALALETAGRAEEALDEFKVAVEMGDYAYPHLNLGLAYVKRGQGELGLRHLRKAVRLWPASPETHYYLGYGLAVTGDEDRARGELRKAIELRPGYPQATALLEQMGRK